MSLLISKRLLPGPPSPDALQLTAAARAITATKVNTFMAGVVFFICEEVLWAKPGEDVRRQVTQNVTVVLSK
jgi:hypothetical protein